ncbi:MAG: tetratricopeptide repeat protein [Alphaproteobacteria bacterium]|nr:tetratricopeptide repeat protein [Alphaproteobacteria bacterium]
MKNITHTLLITLAATSLSACQTTQNPGTSNTPSSAQSDADINEAIERAATSAGLRTPEEQTLAKAEQAYKRNSADPQATLNYGRALRQAGKFEPAAAILTPYANDKDGLSDIKTELSSVRLEQGNYDSAEKYAQEAVLQNPDDYFAYRNLGIALEAKGMHPQAERAFRKGLDTWKGDPTPIMNNLALNLATQGFVDEAIDILEQAKKLAPDNMKIERNLRIVRTLNEH